MEDEQRGTTKLVFECLNDVATNLNIVASMLSEGLDEMSHRVCYLHLAKAEGVISRIRSDYIESGQNTEDLPF